MLPEINVIKIVTLTNITTVTSIITTKKSIKYDLITIKIRTIKETHLIRIHCPTSKTTNLITHPITYKVKEPSQISNFLIVKNHPTKIKINNETKVIKPLTLKVVSQ